MSTEYDEKREDIDLTGKTPEEILALASERGHELTEAELDEISGGKWDPTAPKCPNCGSKKVEFIGENGWLCKNCGHVWV